MTTDTDTLDAEAVVVGSGFGGAVTAARLAEALGDRLLIVERGREIAPGGFPRTGAQVLAEMRTRSHPMGMYDLRAGRDLDILVSNVLGGGSQIYAGVTIPPDDEVFDTVEQNRRIWPAALDGETLHHHYVAVMERLGSRPWPHAAAKADALRSFAETHRLPLERPPLAINTVDGESPACTGCGNCVTGCNVGAKNTLTTNYLRDAAAKGARIRTGIEVTGLRPGTRRRWQLEALHRRDGATRALTIHARVLVLSAGTLGTTELLLRARRDGLPLSDALGTRLSGNGDDWCVAYAPGDRHTAPPTGPTITTTAVVGASDERVLLQDGAIPSAVGGAAARAISALARRLPGALGLRAPALADSRVWLAMGADCPHGTASLDSHGRLTVARDPCIPLDQIRTHLLDDLARSHRARPVRPPRPVPITVHPLGGCPAADDVDHGVVDSLGAVYHPDGGYHDGLYVLDGSLAPTALGANPSLAIAAIADRAAARLIERFR